MKAIIVAGGRGERLRPLTDTIPKPMIEVAGKPILEHIINHFVKHGIQDFILSLCYLPDIITAYFASGSKFGIRIRYIFDDKNTPMDTAGNILSAKKFIKETFIVTYADILRELDILEMIKLHRKKHALATINVYKRFGRNPKSMVTFDKYRKVTKFVERPNQKDKKGEFVWANGSFYIFESAIFKFIPPSRSSDFGKDIFPKLIAGKKPVFAYPSDSYFVDIGSMEKLELARRTYLQSSG